jgi:hypothetical protein
MPLSISAGVTEKQLEDMLHSCGKIDNYLLKPTEGGGGGGFITGG